MLFNDYDLPFTDEPYTERTEQPAEDEHFDTWLEWLREK